MRFIVRKSLIFIEASEHSAKELEANVHFAYQKQRRSNIIFSLKERVPRNCLSAYNNKHELIKAMMTFSDPSGHEYFNRFYFGSFSSEKRSRQSYPEPRRRKGVEFPLRVLNQILENVKDLVQGVRVLGVPPEINPARRLDAKLSAFCQNDAKKRKIKKDFLSFSYQIVR